ncbi:MAG: hypothetical protein JO339_18130 [Alphaproteobacteria bacterium]|nr:hypothetical protein [Alphaproteobacteria bacterium]
MIEAAQARRKTTEKRSEGDHSDHHEHAHLGEHGGGGWHGGYGGRDDRSDHDGRGWHGDHDRHGEHHHHHEHDAPSLKQALASVDTNLANLLAAAPAGFKAALHAADPGIHVIGSASEHLVDVLAHKFNGLTDVTQHILNLLGSSKSTLQAANPAAAGVAAPAIGTDPLATFAADFKAVTAHVKTSIADLNTLNADFLALGHAPSAGAFDAELGNIGNDVTKLVTDMTGDQTALKNIAQDLSTIGGSVPTSAADTAKAAAGVTQTSSPLTQAVAAVVADLQTLAGDTGNLASDFTSIGAVLAASGAQGYSPVGKKKAEKTTAAASESLAPADGPLGNAISLLLHHMSTLDSNVGMTTSDTADILHILQNQGTSTTAAGSPGIPVPWQGQFNHTGHA